MNQEIESLITIQIEKGHQNILKFEGIIYSTWLQGFYFGSPWIRLIPRSVYFKSFQKVIDVILKRPDIYLKTVALQEDPDVILSYAVLETLSPHSVLHWVFTKEVWRKQGLSRKLLEDEEITHVSHLTMVGKSIKPEKWIYNPFLKNGELL